MIMASFPAGDLPRAGPCRGDVPATTVGGV